MSRVKLSDRKKARKPFGGTRLSGKLLLAAVVSLILVEIAWLGGAYLHRTANIAGPVDRETRKLLSAAVDPGVFPTLANEKAVIQRLKDIAYIVGARFEDTAGEPLATIGTAPDITVLEAKRDNISHRLSPDRRYLDLFVPASELQFSHPMVVRVDLTRYYNNLRTAVIEDALTVINIAALTMAGLFIALYPLLLSPIARIRRAIVLGVSDLDIADSFAIRWSRRDELGDLAKAVNELLFAASKNYQEILHAAHDILSATPAASLAYDRQGELVFANPAALELFEAEDLEDLAGRERNLVKLSDADDGTPRSFPDIAAERSIAEEATIVTPKGERLMLCLAGTTSRADGSIRRHTVQFLDLEQALVRMALLAQMSEQATLRRIAADRRSLRLRVMLESCLILLNISGGRKDFRSVDPQEVIVGWTRAYAAAGKARKVVYNRLPAISGNGGRLEILLRQVLSYAEFSSRYANSGFRVIARESDGMVTFDLTEEIDGSTREKTAEELSGESELTLCKGAITGIAAQLDGTFTDSKTENGGIHCRLTIPQIAVEDAADRAA